MTKYNDSATTEIVEGEVMEADTDSDTADAEITDVPTDNDADIDVSESRAAASQREVLDLEAAESDSDSATDTAHTVADAADADVAPRILVDPRGPRFGAAITVVVLAIALLTIPSVTSVVVLVAQAIVFGAAALFGLKAQPYGMLYRSYVAPRLGPPDALEDEAPPRFAQQVGLGFVLIAIAALALGLVVVAQIATALALAAAFLNAAFNFCLGCEIYLLVQRVRSRRTVTTD